MKKLKQNRDRESERTKDMVNRFNVKICDMMCLINGICHENANIM